MAKIDFYVPEPSEVYNKDTQRQIIQALDTLKTQLNTSFQRRGSGRLTNFNLVFNRNRKKKSCSTC
jgi:hypothetical protein